MIRRRRDGARAPHLVEVGLAWPPETFVARKLEGLTRSGFRVTVASIRGWDEGRAAPAGVRELPLRRDRPWRLLASGVAGLLRVLLRSPRRAVALVRAAAEETAAGRPLARIEVAWRVAAYAAIAAAEPDVLHFEWSSTAVELASLPRAIGCPYVVSCHGGDVQVFPHTPEGRWVATGFRPVFRDAAAVHCVAEAVAGEAQRMGLDPEKARLIRAGVDPTVFRPAPGRREDDDFLIVAVGTLWWVKGLEYAVRSVAELVQAGVPAILDVLGGEPNWGVAGEGERLRAVAVGLGIGDRIRLRGCATPAGVRDRLQRADAYLQSSLSEGHPTALVEAMACGLPVVATDVGGTREAMTHGAEGLLVAPRDWRGAAAALAELWRDPVLRARMGAEGRARVEAEFSLARQEERFAALYREVLAA